MRKHKQVLVLFVFMVLFVQNGVYLRGLQLSPGAGDREKAVSRDSEKDEDTSAIVSMTVKDTKLLWVKEKRGSSVFTDLSYSISDTGENPAERKIYGCREKTGFYRQEKYALHAGLRAPPEAETDQAAAKAA